MAMISLEYVSRLKWDKNLGKTLKGFRRQTKTSRRKLSQQLKLAGHDYSHQYLQQLEDGRSETIALSLLLAICLELGISLGQVLIFTEELP